MPTFRRWILCLGDAAVLYGSLLLMLYIRGGESFHSAWNAHAAPFSLIFLVWLAVFFLADFYHAPTLNIDTAFIRRFVGAMSLNVLLAIAVFYVGHIFGIAPKINLLLFSVIFVLLFVAWRGLIGEWFKSTIAKPAVIFVNLDERCTEIIQAVTKENTDFHFAGLVQENGKIICLEKELPIYRDKSDIAKLCESKRVDMIVIGESPEGQLRRELYKQFVKGVRIYDAPGFFELAVRRLPILLLDADWLLREFRDRAPWQLEFMKRICDIICGVFIGILLSPALLCIYGLLRVFETSSPIYSQVRIGKNGKTFTLYKFRTMQIDAEKDGAKWAEQNDPRAMPIGKWLRHTHLDELPQLWNIIRGHMSFVGPRPERPEMMQTLDVQIPFFGLRHLVHPGITGWAQINYPYGSTVEDARKKLSYDLYYIKHWSLFWDARITLKTLTMLIHGEGWKRKSEK